MAVKRPKDLIASSGEVAVAVKAMHVVIEVTSIALRRAERCPPSV